MHVRSVAVILVLLLVAAGGFAMVRELTKPAPLEPVPTIQVNPDPDPEPRESTNRESRERRRENRRREDRRREDRPAAEPSPTQQLTPLEPGGDGTDDDGGED